MPGHQWQEGNNVLSCHCLVWTRTWLFSCNQASQDYRRSTGKGQLNGSQTIEQNRKITNIALLLHGLLIPRAQPRNIKGSAIQSLATFNEQSLCWGSWFLIDSYRIWIDFASVHPLLERVGLVETRAFFWSVINRLHRMFFHILRPLRTNFVFHDGRMIMKVDMPFYSSFILLCCVTFMYKPACPNAGNCLRKKRAWHQEERVGSQ
jgi:hypothetical protein